MRASLLVALSMCAACTTTESEAPPADATTVPMAYFYQYVGLDHVNDVRAGLTADGALIDSLGVKVMEWTQPIMGAPTTGSVYGDPVFSRLANGRWAMTARSTENDPKGGSLLMVHEADCPQVVDDDVRHLKPVSGAGCAPFANSNMGKTSQIFSSGDDSYLFLMSGGDVYLVHVGDADKSVADLAGVCFRTTAATSLAELAVGEATRIIDHTAAGLLLSDTGIARRADGTWVLFVKGIVSDPNCPGGSGLCELCARSVYRLTSSDLITWSSPEKVVEQGSIPEAASDGAGRVWLYWQDFSLACAADDLQLAARAPISGAYEEATGDLSAPVTVSFPEESFEAADSKEHYATNGNPVHLPSLAAQTAFEACSSP